jgi:hypothetical protein
MANLDPKYEFIRLKDHYIRFNDINYFAWETNNTLRLLVCGKDILISFSDFDNNSLMVVKRHLDNLFTYRQLDSM